MSIIFLELFTLLCYFVALRGWWDLLIQVGPNYGYYPNAPKTSLIVKDEIFSLAAAVFEGSGISVTKEGRRHLGAAIGTITFKEAYVREKVATWVQEIDRLTKIAKTQPHAAYAAFSHGLAAKWNYLSRTVPNTADLLQPLEDIIHQHFLPTITGQNTFSDDIRDLLALPVRFGGLGITNPVKQAESHYHTSRKVTAPLVKHIIEQSKELPTEAQQEQSEAKRTAHRENRQTRNTEASDLLTVLPSSLPKAIVIAQETGASTWLTALPIAEHGFALHKGAFRDALCLRYGWRPPLLPSQWICGKSFTVEHTLSCPFSRFPTIRHNEVRDITAHLMSDVCHNVGLEPPLQPITGERLHHNTANTEDGARVDIKAQGFWENDRQCAFFNIRVFNPLTHTYRSLPLPNCYKRHEQEKKRAYDQRIREVEHGCFSPLVFSASGGMGPTARVVYKKLASMVANKHNQSYSQTINWLRCRLSFSLIRSSIMCIRGSRSSTHNPANPQILEAAIDRAIWDSRVASD